MPVALGPLAPGATRDFTLSDVADLGAGRGQYVAFIWFDGYCASGLSLAPGALVDVQAGSAVDAGTLNFVDNDCIQYEAAEPAWRPDRGVVGFTMNGVAQKVDATGNLNDLFSADVQGVFDLAWSPRGDGKILYASNSGVYETSEGGGRGALLIAPSAAWTTAQQLAWLPDASGFVFHDGMNLFLYRFAEGQARQLTTLNVYRHTDQLALGIEPLGALAVSPDGQYVVFERSSPNVLNGRDLWMLNLQNPIELWPVTDDGRAADVDWTPAASGSASSRLHLPLILSHGH